MFRTVPLSITRCLFTVHSAMVCVIQVYVIQLSSRTRMEPEFPSWSCSKAVYKPVWQIPLLSVQWINTWWWTEELSEIFRVSCLNKFVKLVHLVGFIIKKIATYFEHLTIFCANQRRFRLHISDNKLSTILPHTRRGIYLYRLYLWWNSKTNEARMDGRNWRV